MTYRPTGARRVPGGGDNGLIGSLAAFLDEDFIQKIFLLGATALLTGFGVPWIKSRLDDQKFRQQKTFESELARQSTVLESQAKLLDDLSDLLWDFLLLSLAVTFYALHKHKEKFKKAWDTYDEKNWEYFGNIRATLSTARRLTSPTTHEALFAVYNDWFMEFDKELTRVGQLGLNSSEWRTLHDRIYSEGVPLIDRALTELAMELKLAGSNAGRRPEDDPRLPRAE
jgi:hypothetical protein